MILDQGWQNRYSCTYIFMSEFQNFVLEGPKNVFPEQKELKKLKKNERIKLPPDQCISF